MGRWITSNGKYYWRERESRSARERAKLMRNMPPEHRKVLQRMTGDDVRAAVEERIAILGVPMTLVAREARVDQGFLSRFLRGQRSMTTLRCSTLLNALGLVVIPLEHVEAMEINDGEDEES